MAVWTVIDHQEMGASAWSPSSDSTVTSWTKTSIPSTYDHLCLKVSGRTERSQPWDVCVLRFNDDFGNHYSSTFLGGLTTTGSTWRGSGRPRVDFAYWTANTNATSVHGQVLFWIPDYTNTNTYRTVHSQCAAPNTNNADSNWFLGQASTIWTGSDGSSGEAIDEIVLSGYNNDTIMRYSSVTLYGVTGV